VALFGALPASAQDTKPASAPASALAAARGAIAAGEWTKAIELLRPELERRPDDVEVNLALAEAFLGSGELRAARRHADRAQALAPSDPRTMLWAGHVLFRMGEDSASRAGERGLLVRATFADAAAAYEEAAQLGADAYQTGFWAAEAHARAEVPEKAIAAIDRALQARPSDAAASTTKGKLLLQVGRPAEALPLFESVLASSPGTQAAGDAAVGATAARLQLLDVEGVARTFPALTRGDPHGAAARIFETVWTKLRGTAREDAWDALLQEADRFEPPLPFTPYYRAELALRRGRDKEALAFAERYLSGAPGDPAGLLLRAVALRKLGRLPEARIVLGRAYDLDPERPSTREEFRYLVAAFYAAKRWQDAADVQEFVVHLTGAAADRHDLAVLLLDAGSPSDAERIYREIGEDREVPAAERARAWNALALLMRSRKNPDDAEKLFRRALEEDPANLDARENLGLLLVERGRAEEGRRELVTCVSRDPARKRSLYHLLRLAHGEVP
jgi:tetratricopeptide (TPR) repeat protein